MSDSILVSLNTLHVAKQVAVDQTNAERRNSSDSDGSGDRVIIGNVIIGRGGTIQRVPSTDDISNILSSRSRSRIPKFRMNLEQFRNDEYPNLHDPNCDLLYFILGKCFEW